MNAYDEIFGVSWRDQIKEDFRKRAQSARFAVEMYETGRDISLIQDYEGQKYWVFVDELSNYKYSVVLDSTLPHMVSEAHDDPNWEPSLRPFSDHDYDEDYLP